MFGVLFDVSNHLEWSKRKTGQTGKSVIGTLDVLDRVNGLTRTSGLRRDRNPTRTRGCKEVEDQGGGSFDVNVSMNGKSGPKFLLYYMYTF